MVCSNESRRPLTFEERAAFLGLSLPRARFLAACSHYEGNKLAENRTDPIPYDPAVQIAEAYRIGLGLIDTAEMMGMTQAEVMSYGHLFPKLSAYPKPPGLSTHNLFQPEPQDPDVCNR